MLVVLGTEARVSNRLGKAPTHWAVAPVVVHYLAQAVQEPKGQLPGPGLAPAGWGYKSETTTPSLCGNFLISQTPTERLTELPTLNGFSSSKFQRLSVILPKTWSALSRHCPTTLVLISVLLRVTAAVMKHRDQSNLER